MAAAIIWSVAALAYLAFRLWYDNWRGPLSAGEIDAFLAGREAGLERTGNSAEALRAFLAADDGREFVMLNLVKVHGAVDDPATGTPTTGMKLLQRYAARFMPVLIRRGGHPGIVARKVGPYVDAWNTPEDPGWNVVGLMRYRSRRDMIRLAADPRFLAGHPDKLAGTAMTFSFPTQRQISLYAGPRLTVALMLALAAALGHLALLSGGAR